MRCIVRRASIVALMTALTVSAGCSRTDKEKTDTPERRSEGELQILGLRAEAPPLTQTSVSFYAKQGEARETAIFFADSAGARARPYARLRVGANTLGSLPDGTPIAPGDSVLITVKVVEARRMLFSLEPSGLRFNEAAPAELLLSYAEADHDFDRNGQRGPEDDALERRLGIWRQEVAGGPFERLKSKLDEELDQITAPLDGFTRYAISY